MKNSAKDNQKSVEVKSDFGLHGTTKNAVTVRADSKKDVELNGIEQKEVEALGFEHPPYQNPVSPNLSNNGGFSLPKEMISHLIGKNAEIKTIDNLVEHTGLSVAHILRITGWTQKELFEKLLVNQGVWWDVSEEEALLRVLGET